MFGVLPVALEDDCCVPAPDMLDALDEASEDVHLPLSHLQQWVVSMKDPQPSRNRTDPHLTSIGSFCIGSLHR